jgi:hypothetical protein
MWTGQVLRRRGLRPAPPTSKAAEAPAAAC